MLKRFLNAAQSNPQIASGFKQKLGITSPIAQQTPIGMAMRPPVIANKARGTMASHFRQEVRNALPSIYAAFKR